MLDLAKMVQPMIPYAFSGLIFFKTLGMIENGGKTHNLRELQSAVNESTPEGQGLTCKNSKYETDGLQLMACK